MPDHKISFSVMHGNTLSLSFKLTCRKKAYQKNHMHNMLTSTQHNTCITSAGELCRIAVQSGHSYTKPGTARQPTILIMIMIIYNDFIYHLDQR